LSSFAFSIAVRLDPAAVPLRSDVFLENSQGRGSGQSCKAFCRQSGETVRSGRPRTKKITFSGKKDLQPYAMHKSYGATHKAVPTQRGRLRRKIMLEKNIQDILNAGIGLFKVGEQNFQTAIQAVTKTFEELKTKGASDNSEAAQKIREVLDNTIKGLNDVSSKAQENFNTLMAEAQKNYAQLTEQLKTVVGEERIRDVNVRFDELAAFIKDKAGQVSASANTFASQVGSSVQGAVSSATAKKPAAGGSPKV
jgi:hypothetical protein